MIDVPGGAGTLPNRVMIAVSDTLDDHAARRSGPTSSSSRTWWRRQATPASSPTTRRSASTPTRCTSASTCSTRPAASRIRPAFVVRKSSVLGAGPIVVTAFRNLITLSGSFPGPVRAAGRRQLRPRGNRRLFHRRRLSASSACCRCAASRTPGGTPTLSANIPITVATTRFPANVPHLGNTGGTNGQLDGLDDRLYAAQVRNGQLWTAHNIGTNAAGTATTTAADTAQRGALVPVRQHLTGDAGHHAVGNGRRFRQRQRLQRQLVLDPVDQGQRPGPRGDGLQRRGHHARRRRVHRPPRDRHARHDAGAADAHHQHHVRLQPAA